jgi:hypothetical protein
MAGILNTVYSVGILLVAVGLCFGTLWVTRSDDRPINGLPTGSTLLFAGAVSVFLVALVVQYAF